VHLCSLVSELFSCHCQSTLVEVSVSLERFEPFIVTVRAWVCSVACMIQFSFKNISVNIFQYFANFRFLIQYLMEFKFHFIAECIYL
jgi:hypothetical protein